MFDKPHVGWLLIIAVVTALAVAGARLAPGVVRAQGGGSTVVKMTAEEDHKRMMDLLKISELRRGRNGMNPQDPNFANYDEAKANPFPDLPDPLVLKNGKRVTTASEWWKKRRPEIVEDFDREVYGRVPKVTPKVTWTVTSSTPGKNGDVDIVTRQLVGTRRQPLVSRHRGRGSRSRS